MVVGVVVVVGCCCGGLIRTYSAHPICVVLEEPFIVAVVLLLMYRYHHVGRSSSLDVASSPHTATSPVDGGVTCIAKEGSTSVVILNCVAPIIGGL